MDDRYISRAALIELLDAYRDFALLGTDVLDPDTVLSVLTVITNAVAHMETIGPRQLSNKLLNAQNTALAFYVEQARKRIEGYKENERTMEARNNPLALYWRGMRHKTEDYLRILTNLWRE